MFVVLDLLFSVNFYRVNIAREVRQDSVSLLLLGLKELGLILVIEAEVRNLFSGPTSCRRLWCFDCLRALLVFDQLMI